MKRFLKEALLFIAIIFVIFYVLNYIADKGLRRERYGEAGVWNDIYDGKINADLVIMGASRAEVQISPDILDSILHITSYNIGIEGYTFKLAYTRFKVYKEHNRLPKCIVYSLDLATLGRNDGLFYITQFLPYLKDTIIQNATSGYVNSFSVLDYYVPLLKYHSHYSSFKRGIGNFIRAPRPGPGDRIKGYNPKTDPWDGSFEKFVAEHKDSMETSGIDSSTLDEFKDFLSYCKNNSIKVILVYSPEYYPVQKYFSNRSEMLQLYKDLGQKYNASFIDYSNDTMSYEKKYFYNSQHLNNIGSAVFSRKLALDLKGKL